MEAMVSPLCRGLPGFYLEPPGSGDRPGSPGQLPGRQRIRTGSLGRGQGIRLLSNLRPMPGKAFGRARRLSQDFYQGAFENLPFSAAILGSDGTILAVSAAWRQFARDNGGDGDGYLGANYLATCRRAEDREARHLCDELERFLGGQGNTLEWEYPCHSPQVRRWFLMKASRFDAGDQTLVLVSHLDITQRRLAEEAALEKAHHDELTGLLNRNSFPERLQQSLALAQRRGETLAVLFLDLDGFKAVNDRFGHERGDSLLAELGGLMRMRFRQMDAVARLGGDELVLIASPGDPDNAHRLAERVHRLVGEAAESAGVAGYVSASVGISYFPQHGQDPDTLLGKADWAMYQAKQYGRNATAEAIDAHT